MWRVRARLGGAARGSYWQRASYDAVVVIAALLGLIAAAPTISKFRAVHWSTAVVILIALATMGYLALQLASQVAFFPYLSL